MIIEISNVHTALKDGNLKNIFASYGEVAIDGFTNPSRGFGYVEMLNAEEAQKAIDCLNKLEVHGLFISVQQRKLKEVHKDSSKRVTEPSMYTVLKRKQGLLR